MRIHADPDPQPWVLQVLFIFLSCILLSRVIIVYNLLILKSVGPVPRSSCSVSYDLVKCKFLCIYLVLV